MATEQKIFKAVITSLGDKFGIVTDTKIGEIIFYPEKFEKGKHPRFSSLRIGDILEGKCESHSNRYKLTELFSVKTK